MSKPVPKHIANGRAMPKTSDQLHAFIAESLRDLLAIPENAHSFAVATLGAQLRALTDSRELQARAKLEVVLVRTEYVGSVLATVTASDVEGEPLAVLLQIRETDADSPWVSILDKGYNQEQYDQLAKLVLSQTAQPGDEYYITTNQAVDQAREAVSNMMYQQAKKVADFELPAADEVQTPAGVAEAHPGDKATLN